MRAYPAKFDFPLVEKLDQGGPRDIQHVRRFLGGELGVHRDQRDGIPPRHFFQNVKQHAYRRGRNLYGSFCGIVEHAKTERLCRLHA